jgi:hypothetical protein
LAGLLARWARIRAIRKRRQSAARALAEAERARAGAGDSEVVGNPDKRQKEDGDDGVQL